MRNGNKKALNIAKETNASRSAETISNSQLARLVESFLILQHTSYYWSTLTENPYYIISVQLPKQEFLFTYQTKVCVRLKLTS